MKEGLIFRPNPLSSSPPALALSEVEGSARWPFQDSSLFSGRKEKHAPSTRAGGTKRAARGTSVSARPVSKTEPRLLFLRFVGFRLRLGFRFRLVGRRLFRGTGGTRLCLRNQQHPRATV